MVHFDRAALRADPLHERLLVLAKARPWSAATLLLGSGRDRRALSRSLSELAGRDDAIAPFPLRPETVEFIADARREGREIAWLSDEDLGRMPSDASVADLLSDRPNVLRPGATAEDTARQLGALYPDGFAFLGQAGADNPIWRAASQRFAVAMTPAMRRRSLAEGLGIVELSRPTPTWQATLRSMRPHQWLKNLLLFVPFALDVQQLHLRDLGVAIVAFACLCALTSGSYLINDLSDVEADRRHPRKRKRPIASGDLPIAWAIPISLALIVGALVVACLIRYAFAAALGGYLVITLAYSFRLKRMAMVDVLVIALLFTLRILAGMLLVSDKPSHWLLMFSIFFFLSLAFMKREVEFNVMRQAGRTTLSGRGYDLDDRLYVLCCGLSSGIASVVIFALFITATIEHAPLNYGAPDLLWGVMGALGYWVLRMWMLTTRGLMNDDPILFAARDRTSIVLGVACVLLAVGAQALRF